MFTEMRKVKPGKTQFHILITIVICVGVFTGNGGFQHYITFWDILWFACLTFAIYWLSLFSLELLIAHDRAQVMWTIADKTVASLYIMAGVFSNNIALHVLTATELDELMLSDSYYLHMSEFAVIFIAAVICGIYWMFASDKAKRKVVKST